MRLELGDRGGELAEESYSADDGSRLSSESLDADLIVDCLLESKLCLSLKKIDAVFEDDDDDWDNDEDATLEPWERVDEVVEEEEVGMCGKTCTVEGVVGKEWKAEEVEAEGPEKTDTGATIEEAVVDVIVAEAEAEAKEEESEEAEEDEEDPSGTNEEKVRLIVLSSSNKGGVSMLQTKSLFLCLFVVVKTSFSLSIRYEEDWWVNTRV